MSIVEPYGAGSPTRPPASGINLTQYSRGANVANLDGNYYRVLYQMIQDAARAGHNLTIGDGWRDHNTQRAAYDQWRANGTNLAGNKVPSIAKPGSSHHEVGLATDLSYSSTAAQSWVHSNAARYGIAFTVSGEPWHATYTGTPAKQTIAGGAVPGWATFTGGLPNAYGGAGGSGGDVATTADTSGNGVAAAAAFSGQVPSDMRVIRIGSTSVVAKELAPGVWGFFDGPQVGSVTNAPVWTVNQETWDALTKVRIGDVSELDDLATEYTSFGAFFQEMMYMAGIPAAAMSDPSIVTVLAEFTSRPDMTPQELERRLKETQWYQDNSERARAWNDMGRVDKEQAISDAAGQVMDAVFRYGGMNAELSDPQIQQWAEQVASGQTTLSSLINGVIKPMSKDLPDSPWSRTIRDEERAQRQGGIDYENAAGQARSLANRWGVKLSDTEALEWGRKITENVMSQNDLTEYLKDVAQSLYPWKSREQETATAAQPYMQTYGSIMEVPTPDLFDPEIQRAMQAGITTTDWAKELRSSERWLTTKNASDTLTDIGGEVGRIMGFE